MLKTLRTYVWSRITKKKVWKCVQKEFCHLKLINQYRKILSDDLKVLLYEGLIVSEFNYCDAIYGFWLDSVDEKWIQAMKMLVCV